jgi:FdhD protein
MGVLAPEALVRVRVNEVVTLEWSCTPAELTTLTVGWLVSEGIVFAPGEIENVSEEEPEAGYAACLAVRLEPPALGRLTGALSSDASLSVRPAALTTPGNVIAPDSRSANLELRPLLEDQERVATWFRDMFDQAALRSSVGGVHTGGLVVDGRLARVVEDVSRHHVVDRLVGSAFQSQTRLRQSIFLVSARISGAMAAKACRAGVGALVSRSVPTELAAAVAGSHGLILVGRARREAPHYYWPESGTIG